MNNAPYDPFGLLAKLLDHPHGLELANIVYQLHKDTQADTKPDPQLVAIALNVASRKGIPEADRPFFKSKRNADIKTWIEQHS